MTRNSGQRFCRRDRKKPLCHLALTSPPYWILKRYNENPNQLGVVGPALDGEKLGVSGLYRRLTPAWAADIM